MKPIIEVARDLGVEGSFIQYGKWTGKVSLDAVHPTSQRGKLVLVTAITPTPHGEGKTVVSIGLSMALNRLGLRSTACIRQPSLGPVFGVKGGGAGGGRTVLEPMQLINMRLTGDIDAVSAAHNLLAAMIDNHIFHGNELGIDPNSITWPRAMDMNERSLREIIVGLGAKNGVLHRSGFVISAASEMMAILGLSNGYADLKNRLADIIVGYTTQMRAVRPPDLKCVGAMAALLRDALQPNLVQTTEGTPALVHGGPFANIAHGAPSLISINLALNLVDYVVAEAGFGSDLGAEKFIDIVSRVGDLHVDAVVLVASVRALRYHGGVADVDTPDARAVELGLRNLEKHLEIVRLFGLSCVVAVNRFSGDSDEELHVIMEFCRSKGVPCALYTAFEEGSKGSEELAQLVIEASAKRSVVSPAYPLGATTIEKIEAVVTKVYGGKAVICTDQAKRDMKRIAEFGLEDRPICIAKTQYSVSDDPAKIGWPRDFAVTVRGVEPAAGAGFNIVFLGDVVTMPGLPKLPNAERIQLSDEGVITGVK